MLTRYKLQSASISSSLLQQDLESYSRLLPAFSGLKKELQLANMSEAESFNMFGIMKMDYYEVLLHSPIICTLLNPRGSHAQGVLFYNKFIDNVYSGADVSLLKDIRPSNMNVENEMWTQLGQIDVFIRHIDPSNPFALIIENKINAGDQARQLERYYDYAKAIYGIKGTIRMLYLKPLKGDPTDFSINAALLKELTDQGVLKSISYRDNIIPWLKSCLPEVKAPVVKYTIQQYIHTLNKICYG